MFSLAESQLLWRCFVRHSTCFCPVSPRAWRRSSFWSHPVQSLGFIQACDVHWLKKPRLYSLVLHLFHDLLPPLLHFFMISSLSLPSVLSSVFLKIKIRAWKDSLFAPPCNFSPSFQTYDSFSSHYLVYNYRVTTISSSVFFHYPSRTCAIVRKTSGRMSLGP